MQAPYASEELLDAVSVACDLAEAGAGYEDLDRARHQRDELDKQEFKRTWLRPHEPEFIRRLKEMEGDIDMAMATLLETASLDELQVALTQARSRVTFLEQLVRARKRDHTGAPNTEADRPGRLDELLRYLDVHGPKMPRDAADALGISAGAFSSCISANRELFQNPGDGWLLSKKGKERLKHMDKVAPLPA